MIDSAPITGYAAGAKPRLTGGPAEVAVAGCLDCVWWDWTRLAARCARIDTGVVGAGIATAMKPCRAGEIADSVLAGSGAISCGRADCAIRSAGGRALAVDTWAVAATELSGRTRTCPIDGWAPGQFANAA